MAKIELENKERPTNESLERYKAQIEEILAPYEITVEIQLLNNPLVLTSLVNGEETRKRNIWLKPIVINLPGIEAFSVRLHNRKTIDAKEDPARIWMDVYSILDQVYKKSGRVRDEEFYQIWKSRKR